MSAFLEFHKSKIFAWANLLALHVLHQFSRFISSSPCLNLNNKLKVSAQILINFLLSHLRPQLACYLIFFLLGKSLPWMLINHLKTWNTCMASRPVVNFLVFEAINYLLLLEGIFVDRILRERCLHHLRWIPTFLLINFYFAASPLLW